MDRPLAAVVFDLDDTLAVTDRSRQALLDLASARADAPPIDRGDYLAAHGSVDATETREPIFEHLLADHDPADRETAAALTAAYREAIEDAIEPVPDARSLLEGIGRDYRIGCLTDGPLVAQQGKLAELGWTDLFDAVVITGDLPAGKPDEGAFRAISAELGVDPSATAFVGDRPAVDVEGAAAAGFRTVQVLYRGGPEASPAADATVERAALADRLPEILAAL